MSSDPSRSLLQKRESTSQLPGMVLFDDTNPTIRHFLCQYSTRPFPDPLFGDGSLPPGRIGDGSKNESRSSSGRGLDHKCPAN
jgi:hypothetical protein